MPHKVKQVSYISHYKLKLMFENHVIKTINLEKPIKKAWKNKQVDYKNLFTPLYDINYFKMVHCDGDTIFWPNGLCLCPDVLYEEGSIN